jgi:hypothetical protein
VVLRRDTMKRNFLSFLFKILKLNALNKQKIKNENQVLNPVINNNLNEVTNVQSVQEYSTPLSDVDSRYEASQTYSSATYPQTCDHIQNFEFDIHRENQKKDHIVIENIPDLNDDGIIDIRDVVIAVIQEINKHDDFNNE